MEKHRLQFGEAQTTRGVPEDDEPEKGFVYEMDDFQQGVGANQKQCRPEAAWAEEIVPEGIERAMRSLASREVSSTIVALARRLEQIREEQLERYRGKISTLEPALAGPSRLS